jgi:hypothetical protein
MAIILTTKEEKGRFYEIKDIKIKPEEKIQKEDKRNQNTKAGHEISTSRNLLLPQHKNDKLILSPHINLPLIYPKMPSLPKWKKTHSLTIKDESPQFLSEGVLMTTRPHPRGVALRKAWDYPLAPRSQWMPQAGSRPWKIDGRDRIVGWAS